MTDVDALLRALSNVARSDTALTIDVRARVLRTVAAQPRPAPLDVVPIAFAGAAVAVAAAVVVALLPEWRTMFEPWVSYFPR